MSNDKRNAIEVIAEVEVDEATNQLMNKNMIAEQQDNIREKFIKVSVFEYKMKLQELKEKAGKELTKANKNLKEAVNRYEEAKEAEKKRVDKIAKAKSKTLNKKINTAISGGFDAAFKTAKTVKEAAIELRYEITQNTDDISGPAFEVSFYIQREGSGYDNVNLGTALFPVSEKVKKANEEVNNCKKVSSGISNQIFDLQKMIQEDIPLHRERLEAKAALVSLQNSEEGLKALKQMEDIGFHKKMPKLLTADGK